MSQIRTQWRVTFQPRKDARPTSMIVWAVDIEDAVGKIGSHARIVAVLRRCIGRTTRTDQQCGKFTTEVYCSRHSGRYRGYWS